MHASGTLSLRVTAVRSLMPPEERTFVLATAWCADADGGSQRGQSAVVDVAGAPRTVPIPMPPVDVARPMVGLSLTLFRVGARDGLHRRAAVGCCLLSVGQETTEPVQHATWFQPEHLNALHRCPASGGVSLRADLHGVHRPNEDGSLFSYQRPRVHVMSLDVELWLDDAARDQLRRSMAPGGAASRDFCAVARRDADLLQHHRDRQAAEYVHLAGRCQRGARASSRAGLHDDYVHVSPMINTLAQTALYHQHVQRQRQVGVCPATLTEGLSLAMSLDGAGSPDLACVLYAIVLTCVAFPYAADTAVRRDGGVVAGDDFSSMMQGMRLAQHSDTPVPRTVYDCEDRAVFVATMFDAYQQAPDDCCEQLLSARSACEGHHVAIFTVSCGGPRRYDDTHSVAVVLSKALTEYWLHDVAPPPGACTAVLCEATTILAGAAGLPSFGLARAGRTREEDVIRRRYGAYACVVPTDASGGVPAFYGHVYQVCVPGISDACLLYDRLGDHATPSLAEFLRTPGDARFKPTRRWPCRSEERTAIARFLLAPGHCEGACARGAGGDCPTPACKVWSPTSLPPWFSHGYGILTAPAAVAAQRRADEQEENQFLVVPVGPVSTVAYAPSRTVKGSADDATRVS